MANISNEQKIKRRSDLRQVLYSAFNSNELKGILFEIGEDIEHISPPSDYKTTVMDVIMYIDRKGLYTKFIKVAVKQRRDNVRMKAYIRKWYPSLEKKRISKPRAKNKQKYAPKKSKFLTKSANQDGQLKIILMFVGISALVLLMVWFFGYRKNDLGIDLDRDDISIFRSSELVHKFYGEGSGKVAEVTIFIHDVSGNIIYDTVRPDHAKVEKIMRVCDSSSESLEISEMFSKNALSTVDLGSQAIYVPDDCYIEFHLKNFDGEATRLWLNSKLE